MTILTDQVSKGKQYLNRRGYEFYFAYFQQETTTAAPCADLMEDFAFALGDPGCIGLIVSTRPDFIEEELLDEMEKIACSSGKEIILEIGLQSVHEKSLLFLNRNHSSGDFFQAVAPLDVWTGKLVFSLILAGMFFIPIVMFLWMRKRAWM